MCVLSFHNLSSDSSNKALTLQLQMCVGDMRDSQL